MFFDRFVSILHNSHLNNVTRNMVVNSQNYVKRESAKLLKMFLLYMGRGPINITKLRMPESPNDPLKLFYWQWNEGVYHEVVNRLIIATAIFAFSKIASLMLLPNCQRCTLTSLGKSWLFDLETQECQYLHSISFYHRTITYCSELNLLLHNVTCEMASKQIRWLQQQFTAV